VVNDAYNANPESVRAALEALVTMGRPAADRGARRTVAVLGEMRELGDRSVPEHEEIGRIAVRLGVGRLVLVGHSADVRAIGDAALDEDPSYAVVRVPDAAAAVDHLAATVDDHDVVLVKASRGVALERVADGLLRSMEVAS